MTASKRRLPKPSVHLRNVGFGVRIESAVSTEATPWPKRFWKCLQHSRKHQSISRGTCGAPANAKKFSEALAGLPQTPKSFPRHLRDSRKHQKVSRETCNGVASISKSSLAVAARYPRHPLWIGNPILSSNSRYGKEDHARGWDLHRSAKSLKAGAVLMQLPWRRLGL